MRETSRSPEGRRTPRTFSAATGIEVPGQESERSVPALPRFRSVDTVECVAARRIDPFTIVEKTFSVLPGNNHRIAEIAILDDEHVVVVGCRMYEQRSAQLARVSDWRPLDVRQIGRAHV